MSVVILTKNEAGRIREAIESVRWADEVLIVDDESTDETPRIAESLGCRVLRRKMDIEGRHRNWAYAQARNEWIFSLDADERITPELGREIQTLLSGTPAFEVYTVPRRNYLGSRWIRHGGWYPSRQIKLFKRSVFRWEEAPVHPRAISDRPSGQLEADLLHYSYRDLSDFVGKLNRQTTLEARKWVEDGRRMPLARALHRTFDRFWRAYVGKRGRLDGDLGWILAGLAASYQWISYLKYRLHTPPAPGGMAAVRRSRPLSEAALTRSPRLAPPHRCRNERNRESGVSCVIITKNEAARLPRCLAALDWADEIVVIDDESTDGTAQIARARGARVESRRSGGNFNAQREFGTETARGPWILQLDADEVVSAPLAEEILERTGRDPEGREWSAYTVLRRNHFLGRPMRHGGWAGQRKIQLYRKGAARYVGPGTHERLEVTGPTGALKQPMDHYPFEDLEAFIDRQNFYTCAFFSTGEVKLYVPDPFGIPDAAVRARFRRRPFKLFWKTYVKKRGFLDGRIGFIFATLAAWVEFIRWAKLWELRDNAR